MKNLKLFVLLIALTAFSGSALACKCIPKGELTAEEVNNTAMIFTGKVLKVESVEGEMKNKVTFKVKKGLKGLKKGQIVTVYTNSSSAACGITFTQGEEWYLFLSESNSVGMCNRTTRMYRDLKAVEPQYRKDEKAQQKKHKQILKQDKKLICEAQKSKQA